MTAAGRRDRALQDLVDLDRQVAAGELTESDATPLRRRYERAAADALDELADTPAEAPAADGAEPTDRAPAEDPDQDRPRQDQPRTSRRTRVRLLSGLAAAAVVAVIAVLLLPAFIGDRPAGGFVTGNEARGTPPPPAASAPGRDLSKVSDAEMEAVIADNPDVPGMRLALGARYAAKGRYGDAASQYLAVLDRDPGNAQAQAQLGWVTFQTGQPQVALTLVDRALRSAPAMVEALWIKANILLYGTADPRGAADVLRQMQRQPLTPEVGKQVTDLLEVAQARSSSR